MKVVSMRREQRRAVNVRVCTRRNFYAHTNRRAWPIEIDGWTVGERPGTPVYNRWVYIHINRVMCATLNVSVCPARSFTLKSHYNCRWRFMVCSRFATADRIRDLETIRISCVFLLH